MRASRALRRCCAATLVLLLFVGTATGSQERPDFSGAWSATGGGGRGRGGPAGAMGSGWGQDITIVQDDAMLTIERVFYEPGDLQPVMKFRYALDGLETTNTVLMGRGFQRQVSSAAWDGDRLVITTAFEYFDEEAGAPATYEVRRTLSLQSAGYIARPPTLVVETIRPGIGDGPPETARTVYARR